MSDQISNGPISVPKSSTIDSETLISKSPLLNHLYTTYPLIDELTAVILSFTFVNSFTAFILKSINELKTTGFDKIFPVSYILDTIRSFEAIFVNVFFVNFLDRFLPFLQVIHLNDFTPENLYSSSVNYGTSKLDSTKAKASTLYHDAGSSANSLIENTLKSVNPRLSSLIKDEKLVSTTGSETTIETSNENNNDESTSEVAKFVQITHALADQVKSYPLEVQTHVTKIYNDEITKNNNNSIKAIASTSNELASELATGLSKKLSNSGLFKKSTSIVESVSASIGTNTGITPAVVNGGTSGSNTEVTEAVANGEISVVS